jgi:hypothetical protein
MHARKVGETVIFYLIFKERSFLDKIQACAIPGTCGKAYRRLSFSGTIRR